MKRVKAGKIMNAHTNALLGLVLILIIWSGKANLIISQEERVQMD
jgi:hypothetical protein